MQLKPVICNLSRRAKKYWLLVEKIVSERYKSHLMMAPIEKLMKEVKDHEEADKEEYAKVKTIIHEIILKAIPKEIATEATQKRFEEPINLMLLIMIKYQPGSRKETEAILQQIGSPEVGWTEDKALTNLKLWKRKIDRAKELGLVIPDPAVLIVALYTITRKVIAKDTRRKFRIDTARESEGRHLSQRRQP